MSNAVTQAEFARLQGWSRSHVTRLRQEGRLKVTGSGRDTRVLVAESLALVSQTRGTRDDVADRHAETRSHQGSQQYSSAPPASPPSYDQNDQMEKARRVKAISEARRVSAAADREEMERDKLAGDLIAREDVDAAMKFVGATVRSEMEILPDQLAPLVVPITSIEEAHTLIAEAGRNILVRLGEAIERQQAALARHT